MIRGIITWLLSGKAGKRKWLGAQTFFKDFYMLLNSQYQLHRIIQNGLVKIEEYNQDLEIFKTSNYRPVLKVEAGSKKA